MAYDLNTETWSEYGIGIFFLLLRLVARLNMGGIRGLRLDDAFSILAIVMSPIRFCVSIADDGTDILHATNRQYLPNE